MKIYTKTGDKGETSLISGKRISKADIQIESYGNVDELNSHVGMLADMLLNDTHYNLLREIQDRLFIIGSMLANDPEKPFAKLPEIIAQDITDLENAIDNVNEYIPPMRAFILPGGYMSISQAHIARCVCRRAERGVIRLGEQFNEPLVVQYLNRLSDFLFTLARHLHHTLNINEIAWKAREK
jgi:cob(I)alamin adenosyltransferase